jgi:hypothetical protein
MGCVTGVRGQIVIRPDVFSCYPLLRPTVPNQLGPNLKLVLRGRATASRRCHHCSHLQIEHLIAVESDWVQMTMVRSREVHQRPVA